MGLWATPHLHKREKEKKKKISPADNVFLARLFDLDDDRDDEQDDDQATGHSDDGEVSVVQRVQDAGFPFL